MSRGNEAAPRFTREDFLLPPEGSPDDRRRAFRAQLFLFAVTLFVALVLGFAAYVRAGLGLVDDAWAALYVIIGVLVPLRHLDLALRARAGRLVEVRHWTFLLLPIHVAWGSGLFVGLVQAVPIGIGLAMLDLLVLRGLVGIE